MGERARGNSSSAPEKKEEEGKAPGGFFHQERHGSLWAFLLLLFYDISSLRVGVLKHASLSSSIRIRSEVLKESKKECLSLTLRSHSKGRTIPSEPHTRIEAHSVSETRVSVGDMLSLNC